MRLLLVLGLIGCGGSSDFTAAESRAIFDGQNGEVHQMHLEALELAEWPAAMTRECPDGGSIEMTTVFDGADIAELLHALDGCGVDGAVATGDLDYLDIEVVDCSGQMGVDVAIVGQLEISGALAGRCLIDAREGCSGFTGDACGHPLQPAIDLPHLRRGKGAGGGRALDHHERMDTTTALQPRAPDDGGAVTAVALAAVGTAAIGWIIALPDNVFASIRMALATPAIVLGLTCALTPALYIVLALSGAKTGPRRFGAAIRQGLRATGLAALGFCGPLLFLAATSESRTTAELLGGAGLAISLIVGLVALDRRAAADHTNGSALGIIIWSFAALAIGFRLLQGALS